ncbi:MAG: DUF4179 domain-containing protein [Oscillospiraceae bacterium]|nr:DUF4179 domain-containing protein [Oscillospiraceae bacterium]
MKDDTLFWALCDMDEALILEAKEVPIMKKKSMKPMRIALIAAAITILLAGAVFAVYQYTRSTESLADRWEVFGNTEMPEAQKDYIDGKSANIGESVTDQDVTITLDSVTAAEKSAYLIFRIHPDPEVYGERQPTQHYTLRFSDSEIYAENPNYGRIEGYSGGGGGGDDENGDEWAGCTVNFDTLPEDAGLNDGNTTLYISLHTLMQMGPMGETPEIHGTWTFEMKLPQSETPDSIVSEETLSFSGGVEMEIRDIVLRESDVEFVAVTDNSNYIFVGSGTQAELARMAEPDKICLTVEAVLLDGTLVPTTGIHVGRDLDSREHRWSIDWAAPLDPMQIATLVFSDGAERFEVKVNH